MKLRKVKLMETDKVKIEGDEVTLKTGSAEEARKVAAYAERGVYREERGADGWIDEKLDSIGRIGETIGRPIFEWAAWALAIVGGFVAYISWSRLTPDDQVKMLFGVVGVIIILVVKISAGRWAKADNKEDKEKARTYASIAIGGLLVNMFVAVTFQAAVSQDERTGTLDIDRTILTLERQERELTRSIDGMRAPPLPLDVLQYDLEQALNAPALNNANEQTPLTVAEVVAWDTDDYCMPGTQYPSYVERYCPDIIDMHRAVKLRTDYEAAIIQRDTVRQQIADSIASRPASSSGLALGDQLAKGGNNWYRYVPGALLMLIIELFMVLAQYIAKRHPKGV